MQTGIRTDAINAHVNANRDAYIKQASYRATYHAAGDYATWDVYAYELRRTWRNVKSARELADIARDEHALSPLADSPLRYGCAS